MKKIFLIVFSAFLICSCENNVKTNKYEISLQSQDDLKSLLVDENYPLVSAHRGGSAEGFPENAIETFERATTFGPVIIETDIAMTKDSVLVLMHDDKLDRTTTGKGYVNNYLYSDIQEFHLKDYKNKTTSYKIPTLEEALIWGKDKVIFTLDIKRGVPYEKVIDLVRKTNSEANSVLITYNANQARAIHKLDKELWLSVSANTKQDIDRLKDYKVDITRIVAFVGTAEPSAQSIQYLRSVNVPIILGTLGNLDKRAKSIGDNLYKSFYQKGINILSADRNKEASIQAEAYAKEMGITSKYISIKQ